MLDTSGAGVGAGVGVAEAVVSGVLVAAGVDSVVVEGALLERSLEVLGAVARVVDFETVRVDFVDFFGAAAGTLVDSVVSFAVAVAGAGTGAGVATAGVPASATTVDLLSVAVVVSGVAGFDDARFDAGAAIVATGFEATSWLNRNAPAITRAMITPNAIGKCFTEASC